MNEVSQLVDGQSVNSSESGLRDVQNIDPSFHALQACNECKRRKGRCDRVAPQCGPCLKYKRHCLYEQHSKSPLTRKHLTYVEHRLEAATTELHILRRKIRALQSTSKNETSMIDEASRTKDTTLKSASVFEPSSFGSYNLTPEGNGQGNGSLPMRVEPGHANAEPRNLAFIGKHIPGDESPQIKLERPPVMTSDFDWDEIGTSMDSEWPTTSKDVDEGKFVDGMASLSTDENDAGYFGVASGAALLRILQPDANYQITNTKIRQTKVLASQTQLGFSSMLLTSPDPNLHIIDAMIDGYFRTYHLSYPIVHEPRFRAQHSEVIPRPEGNGWKALVYVVAAIGAFSTSMEPGAADVALFHIARSQLSMDDLQSGNISLVQALTLMSNFLQKRNKPNSGYNYLGLALRMAMGLGLHKEFPKWDITPLQMEIRRRVWWTMFVFDIGATITFSRPIAWPIEGIEVALPLNIHDRHLTVAVTSYPYEAQEITTYSAVRAQVTFHRATNPIYTRVISVPFPASLEVLTLDQQHIVPWLESLPPWYSENAVVPPQYSFGHAVMMWRYHNLRLIMYRPFVIRKLLKARQDQASRVVDAADEEACRRCLNEAAISISMISNFWSTEPHTKLTAWYVLYFLFQASLIPVFCLRNDPLFIAASTWRQDINLALEVIESMFSLTASSTKCYNTIKNLCGQYLENSSTLDEFQFVPTGESPQTQLTNVYSMMWPNVPLAEADVVMQDDAWIRFLDAIPSEEQMGVSHNAPEGQWNFL